MEQTVLSRSRNVSFSRIRHRITEDIENRLFHINPFPLTPLSEPTEFVNS